jgi:hypothetical protein
MSGTTPKNTSTHPLTCPPLDLDRRNRLGKRCGQGEPAAAKRALDCGCRCSTLRVVHIA